MLLFAHEFKMLWLFPSDVIELLLLLFFDAL